MENLIAKAQIGINAPINNVWDALVNPDTIKKYMFGTTVTSDWTEGSKITWKGVWEGKPYEDKGEILQFKPDQTLQYSHFSPMSGQKDIPENYHKVTIELTEKENLTLLALSQDNNTTEQEKEHSEKNWTMMLHDLKNLLEIR